MIRFCAGQVPLKRCGNSIIIGHIGANLADQAAAAVSQQGHDAALVRGLVEQLRPSFDKFAAVESWSRLEDGAMSRLCVAALPKACSRHNCPAQPHAITDALKSNKGRGDLSVILLLAHPSHAAAAGCAVARAFPRYALKRERAAAANVDVYMGCDDTEALRQIGLIAEGIQTCAELVDTPCNILNVPEYIKRVQELVSGLPNVTIQVISGEDLEKEGLRGIYGVGKAAVGPPAMVVLSYTPPDGAAGKPVAWVGKGIVYDTGGLSIKSKDGMPGMKTDMGGSAAVLCAFVAAVKRGNLNRPLSAILCMAENSVSAAATRPDDIHVMYSGKTVEINNTDAEGRLVLADGVAWAAKQLQPAVIVDMATLTGAQGVATGHRHAAMYCNNEKLEAAAQAAGRQCGDLTFPVPYAPEFFAAEFASAVADMKNSVACRSNAQVSCAAQFIGNHLEPFFEAGGAWLHIDMAAPSHQGPRATGYGVALLCQLLDELPAAGL